MEQVLATILLPAPPRLVLFVCASGLPLPSLRPVSSWLPLLVLVPLLPGGGGGGGSGGGRCVGRGLRAVA